MTNRKSAHNTLDKKFFRKSHNHIEPMLSQHKTHKKHIKAITKQLTVVLIAFNCLCVGFQRELF